MVSSTQNKPFSRLEYIDADEAFKERQEEYCKSIALDIASVAQAKDPQHMFNYWKTASVELIALKQNAPYIVMGLGKRSLWQRVVSFIKGLFNG
jgi:hypothetical protein